VRRVDHDAEGADPNADLVDRRAEGSKAGGEIILNLGGLSVFPAITYLP
jgi:hypothetical protein